MPSDTCTGSKCQVYSGNATRTSGNLRKTDLTRNSQGRIVSRSQSDNAKKKFGSSVLQGRFLSAKHVAKNNFLPLQDVLMAKPGSSVYDDVHARTIQWCANNGVEWTTNGIPAYYTQNINGNVKAVSNPEWIAAKKRECMNKMQSKKAFGSRSAKEAKSGKSGKLGKSGKSGKSSGHKHSSGKSGKSGKSGRAGKLGKSGKSGKSLGGKYSSGKSAKSGKSLGHMHNSGKLGKSSKSGKHKHQSGKLGKLGKSGKARKSR